MGYYYTRDHLGSVREMVDSSGAIQARYDYDPNGVVTKVSGSMDSDFQYAGMYAHQPSGLNLTQYRAYDPNTARWLSRDPLPDAERSQGPNLYEYVYNDPAKYTDPLGLAGGGRGSGAGHQCPCGQHLSPYLDESEFVKNEALLNPTNFGPEGDAGIAVVVGWVLFSTLTS